MTGTRPGRWPPGPGVLTARPVRASKGPQHFRQLKSESPCSLLKIALEPPSRFHCSRTCFKSLR